MVGTMEPMVNARLSIEGHLLDEQTLTKVFSIFDQHQIKFQVKRFRIGEAANETSLIELILSAIDQDVLDHALQLCEPYGARFTTEDAKLAIAEQDGVLPEGFYSTTNRSPCLTRCMGQVAARVAPDSSSKIRIPQSISRFSTWVHSPSTRTSVVKLVVE